MNNQILIQTTITIEELGELAQALGKYVRYMSDDGTLRKGIISSTDILFQQKRNMQFLQTEFCTNFIQI